MASACSDDEAPPTTASNISGGNGICIRTDFIDHTDIPDDKTIIFHMKGGIAYRNSLQFACTSLKNEGGFTFITDFPEVCSNAQTIRVLRSGILCELGQFTPYAPPPASAAAAEPAK
jgi:hypothetical protein